MEPIIFLINSTIVTFRQLRRTFFFSGIGTSFLFPFFFFLRPVAKSTCSSLPMRDNQMELSISLMRFVTFTWNQNLIT